MAAPTAVRMRANIALTPGDTDGDIPSILNFAELTTETANNYAKYSVELAASATNQTVSLSSFTTVTWIAVVDRGGTGLLVGTATGTTGRMTVKASKLALWSNGAGTPPTIYLDNVSVTDSAFVDVYVFGTQS